MEIKLEPLKGKHIVKTFQWIENPYLLETFLIRGELDWKTHEEYWKRKTNDQTQRVFAITVDGVHVGNCGFKNLSFEKFDGELWIYIGDTEMHKKGIGEQATKRLLEFGFEHLKLSKIYLHVAQFNIPAVNLYRKIGFNNISKPLDENWSNRGCAVLYMEVSKEKWMSQ